MSISAAGLLALALLPFGNTLDFSPAPTPAPTQHFPGRPAPFAPQPTPGLHLRQPGVLRRRDDLQTDAYWASRQPNLCGWTDATLTSDHQVSCAAKETCKYHASNNNFQNLIGCCSGSDCRFQTTCYGASDISKSPKLTNSKNSFSLLCTNSKAPACVTFVYSDLSVTDFGCGATGDLLDVYTSAFDNVNTRRGTITRDDLYLTGVSDEDVSSYTASWASRTNVQSRLAASPQAHSTQTSAAKPTSFGSSSTASIVGGVIGGVAGGIAIALAGVFLFWKMRKSKKVKAEAAAGAKPGGSNGYQSVPGSLSSQSGTEMRAPVELASNDPSHRLTEAQGSTPAHEMANTPATPPANPSANPTPEMAAEPTTDDGARHIIAELPADHDDRPKSERGG